MKTHTLTVRDRRLSWDDRRLTRDFVAVDEVAVDMDEEYRGCDTVVAVMVSAAHQDPVRMVVEGGRIQHPERADPRDGQHPRCRLVADYRPRMRWWDRSINRDRSTTGSES